MLYKGSQRISPIITKQGGGVKNLILNIDDDGNVVMRLLLNPIEQTLTIIATSTIIPSLLILKNPSDDDIDDILGLAQNLSEYLPNYYVIVGNFLLGSDSDFSGVFLNGEERYIISIEEG